MNIDPWKLFGQRHAMIFALVSVPMVCRQDDPDRSDLRIDQPRPRGRDLAPRTSLHVSLRAACRPASPSLPLAPPTLHCC